MFHLNRNEQEPECAAVVLAREEYYHRCFKVRVAADYGVFDTGLLRDAGNAFTAYRHALAAANSPKSNRRNAARAYPAWHD